VIKNCEDWPRIPTVPGPVMSARTLTNENAPLMTPKPRPDTADTNDFVSFHSWATYLREMSWSISWKFDVIFTSQLMHIYLKNNPAKFHPDPIWIDRALGFLKRVTPKTTKWVAICRVPPLLSFNDLTTFRAPFQDKCSLVQRPAPYTTSVNITILLLKTLQTFKCQKWSKFSTSNLTICAMPANGPRLPKISKILQLNLYIYLSTFEALLSIFKHHYHFWGLFRPWTWKWFKHLLRTFKGITFKGKEKTEYGISS